MIFGRTLAAIMTVTSIAALTACSRTPRPAPADPTAAPPAGLTIGIAQYRGDEPAHRLQATVRNQGPHTVRFTAVRLESGSFEPLPPAAFDHTIGRTPRTDLPMPYGRARCNPTTVPEPQPSAVIARISLGDQPPHDVRFPLPHPDPLLSRLLRAECEAHIIRQTADFAFGDEWTHHEGGELLALRGTLHVTRRGGTSPVTIQDVGGTTHYTVDPRPGKRRPIATLEGNAAELAIPVEITPGRCDAHAFAEAKKAYLFPVWVSIAGGETRSLIVTPPKKTQDAMLAYARKACGVPG
ncbi:hypothetical protein HS041_17655 [Planomonospora sp. ID67723]|uniref:hypothetical protein n=1 Tax=Planomonospora sp. ID67723 TaxID=2738134 RepID=UPI0018C446E5|nr:hypothetical protein [Planomonospora sp. ID67723]MBG0829595.1 hypothetical protein [Planomonospora sp. ID67723]